MNNFKNNNYRDIYNYYNMINSTRSNYIKDYGPEPFVCNIEEITKSNNTFRT